MLAKDKRKLNPTYRACTSPKVRGMWMEALGTKCRICGAEPVEYHHLIPVKDGGTNDIGNVVPLCHRHHNMVHNKVPRDISQNTQGRKPIPLPDNADEIYGNYLGNEITLKEAMEQLGIKRNKFYIMLEAYRVRTGDQRQHYPIFKGGRYDRRTD